MKNRYLIYTIVDDRYMPLLSMWVRSIRDHNPFLDIALIVPDVSTIPNGEINDIILLKTDSFDYKYTTKYTIIKYDIFNQYTDFLYLDLDIICTKPLDEIFIKIAEYPTKIHTRTEHICLNSTDSFHKFNKDTIVDESLSAFNAGSFGFNRAFKQEIHTFLQFINNNKEHAICDQPLFNMFFSVNNKTIPTLDAYVWLDGYRHSLSQDKFNCIHFLGCYGDISNKIKRIQDYDKNKR